LHRLPRTRTPRSSRDSRSAASSNASSSSSAARSRAAAPTCTAEPHAQDRVPLHLDRDEDPVARAPRTGDRRPVPGAL